MQVSPDHPAPRWNQRSNNNTNTGLTSTITMLVTYSRTRVPRVLLMALRAAALASVVTILTKTTISSRISREAGCQYRLWSWEHLSSASPASGASSGSTINAINQNPPVSIYAFFDRYFFLANILIIRSIPCMSETCLLVRRPPGIHRNISRILYVRFYRHAQGSADYATDRKTMVPCVSSKCVFLFKHSAFGCLFVVV